MENGDRGLWDPGGAFRGVWADGSAGCEAAEGFGVAAVLCSSSSEPVTNSWISF